MSMFRSLIRSVFWPTPYDNFAHSVQDAMSIFKVPSLSPSHSVKVCLANGRWERPGDLCLTDGALTSHLQRGSTPNSAYSIPDNFQRFDKDISYFVAGIFNQGQFVQLRVPGGYPDRVVYIRNLEYRYISGAGHISSICQTYDSLTSSICLS